MDAEGQATVRRRASSRCVRLVVALCLVAYGWWATDFRPFTWPARDAIGGMGLIVLVVGGGQRRARRTLRAWWEDNLRQLGEFEHGSRPGAAATLAGRVAWAVVGAAALAWELFAFTTHPRAAHPTVSSVVKLFAHSHPVRVVMFLMWVALGWEFMDR